MGKLRKKYDKETLPYFAQRKNTSAQDYVTGFEPGTGLPVGRSENIRGNKYKRMKPEEKVVIDLELGLIVL